MEISKGALGAAGAAAAAVTGTVLLAGKLSKMKSGDIREVGSKVKEFVSDCGAGISSSSIGKSLVTALSAMPVTAKLTSLAAKGVSMGSAGFSAMMNGIADAKAKSEREGSDFAGNLADGLKGAVSNGWDYVSEKLGAVKNAASVVPAVAAPGISLDAGRETPDTGPELG